MPSKSILCFGECVTSMFSTFCMPYLLNVLDKVDLTCSVLCKLERTWNAVYWKLFHVNEHNIGVHDTEL